MPMSSASSEHADDDGLLMLGRVPAAQEWYDEATGELDVDAFKPHPTGDVDGLSVSRMKLENNPDFLTPEQLAGLGRSPRGYYVAIVRESALISLGVRVERAPTAQDPGHCLLSNMNSANRKSTEVKDWCHQLVEKHLVRVEEPFRPS